MINSKLTTEIFRVFTSVMMIILTSLVSVLLWVYNTDRQENKEFQQRLSNKIENGFSLIADEFKTVRQEEASYREKTSSQIATIRGVCCSETRSKYMQESSIIDY